MFDQRNPAIIICSRELERALNMKALHVTEIRFVYYGMSWCSTSAIFAIITCSKELEHTKNMTAIHVPKIRFVCYGTGRYLWNELMSVQSHQHPLFKRIGGRTHWIRKHYISSKLGSCTYYGMSWCSISAIPPSSVLKNWSARALNMKAPCRRNLVCVTCLPHSCLLCDR